MSQYSERNRTILQDGKEPHPGIWITGDTHGDIDWEKLNSKRFPEQKEMYREDVVIIAGDFGGVWREKDENGSEHPSDRYILDTYEKRNFTTVFVDGNHDNHEAIARYPVNWFCGAKCNQIRPHVFHVCRGEVLHICGHRIWCMGGAESHGKEYRRPYVSWWPEEIPSYAEWKHAEAMLIEERPDILVTHDSARWILASMGLVGTSENPTPVQKNFDEICRTIQEKKIPVRRWFFGHHHIDRSQKWGEMECTCLYNRIVSI